MSTTTNLSTLKINYLTQAQYDEALANSQINEDELYFTPGTGGDAGHVELTQAQYDALTPSQQTDGTVYFITDANSTPNNIVDFIVEQGTSGIWTYRKWHSGIAECWGLDSRSRAITNSFGNAYYADLTAISFPSGLFTTAPTVTASRANIGNTTGLVTVSIGADATKVYGYAYSAASLTTTVAISFHAIGTWK